MDASLDTNVIIHLYKAELQSLLFDRFQGLQVYEFIRDCEMAKHADSSILARFDADVAYGRVQLVTYADLQRVGMYEVFQEHVSDMRYLFSPRDLGEIYAISLARTLGSMALVTDDIKERGPHYFLLRMPDSDVMPFAFYELLFLDYLEGKITESDVLARFCLICDRAALTLNCASKVRDFTRRFWTSPYKTSEKQWLIRSCRIRGIGARLKALASYLDDQVPS